MACVHIDTMPLAWGLRVFAYPNRKHRDEKHVTSALELCNNLVLRDKVYYDGAVHKGTRDEINELIDRISKNLGHTDLENEFTQKIQPVTLKPEKDHGAIDKAVKNAFNVFDELYEKKESLIKLLRIYEPEESLAPPAKYFYPYLKEDVLPSHAELDSVFSDRVKGYRFYRGMLSNEHLFEKCKSLKNSKRLEVDILKILFTQFRTIYAMERAYEKSQELTDLIIHYHPTPERREISQKIGAKIRRTRDLLEEELEPQITKIWYDRVSEEYYGACPYVVPFSLNTILQKAQPKSPIQFLRECLDFSHREDGKKLLQAMSEYELIKDKGSRVKFLEDLMNTVSLGLQNKHFTDSKSKQLALKVIEDNVNLVALFMDVVKYEKWRESGKLKAAIALAEPTALLSDYESFCERIQGIFGGVPKLRDLSDFAR